MKETKDVKKYKSGRCRCPCVGCEKPTPMGIPYTICENCKKVIHRWENAKEGTHQIHRAVAGIEQLKFDEDNDISDNLNYIGRYIADIEENLMWMKNCLFNIETARRTKEEWRKKNKAKTNEK